MNKENCVCVCVCDGIIFLKKEGNVIICKKVNESRGHCAKLNKPYLEKQVSHDFTFKWILKKIKLTNSMMVIIQGWVVKVKEEREWERCCSKGIKF